MKKLGVFMDVSNLYYSTMYNFNGRKLNYKAYLDYIKDLGEIKMSVAYGAQLDNQANGFINCLKEMGFTTKFKRPKTYSKKNGITRKADWDVGIAVDIIDNLDKLDMIILGSADGDFVPLVKYIQARGKQVVITASGISLELADVADESIEIFESILEVK